MSVQAECGACGAKYELEAKYAGQKLRCVECDKVFVVPLEEAVSDSLDPPDLLDLAERVTPKKVAEEGPPPVGTYKPPVPSGGRKKMVAPVKLAAASPEQKPISAHEDVEAPEVEVAEVQYGKAPRRAQSAASVEFMSSYFPLLICLGGYLPIVIAMFSSASRASSVSIAWLFMLINIVMYLVFVIPFGALGLGLGSTLMRFSPPTPVYFVVLSMAAAPLAVVLLGQYFSEESGSKGYLVFAFFLAVPITFVLFSFYNRQGFALDLATFVLIAVGLVLGTVLAIAVQYKLVELIQLRHDLARATGS